MSLDVYLYQENAKVNKRSSGIFIRENGETKEITAKEWYDRHPDQEPVVRLEPQEYTDDEVYSANITHNLGSMAALAGIYTCLWRPEEINITKAKQLIQPLKEGLNLLKAVPEKFKACNPKNGWGNYEGLVKFVENYLNACIEYPDATVSAS